MGRKKGMAVTTGWWTSSAGVTRTQTGKKRSEKSSPMKLVWESPSGEQVEHAGKPRAGMLLKLAGTLPTGRPEDYLQAGWQASETHWVAAHGMPPKRAGVSCRLVSTVRAKREESILEPERKAKSILLQCPFTNRNEHVANWHRRNV